MLAARYVELTNRGEPHPVMALGLIIVRNPSTVRGHLWQARRRGLLEGSAGRVGGTLTPKARALLR